jgi:DNA-binding NtrC family response regulator
MDGLTFLRKAKEQGSDAVFIVITGFADVESAVATMKAGSGPATASYVAPGATLREMERDAILRTLAITGGSTVRAAKMLGISARKVQYRVKEYRQTEQLPHDESEAPADGSKAVA